MIDRQGELIREVQRVREEIREGGCAILVGVFLCAILLAILAVR